MPFRDLKYIMGILPPLPAILGLYLGGWFSPGLLYFGLIVVPLIELFVPASVYNEPEELLQQKTKALFYDLLLYLNVPLLYFTIGYFIYQYTHAAWSAPVLIFSILNVGMLIGVSGINVAHELGHRQDAFDRWMSRLLLLPALYSHYTLEHNYGHHVHVGTPEDPATARKNEMVYSYYFRTIFFSYLHAWELGFRILKAKNRPRWMHEIPWMHLAQILYLFLVFRLGGWGCMLSLMGCALVGILFLETVNYIEHYGLARTKMASGRYEPMNDTHSWNSNHELGRMMLFELVRHADHHFQTNRKYPALRHLDKAPQLPFGYPMTILLSLVPPLWFRIMNPRIAELHHVRAAPES